MIVYDLKQTGLKLKSKLQNDCSLETAEKISLEIKQAVHANGTPLTNEEKRHLVNYIQFPVYDHKTGHALLYEADNAEFLKLVAVISKAINDTKQLGGFVYEQCN